MIIADLIILFFTSNDIGLGGFQADENCTTFIKHKHMIKIKIILILDLARIEWSDVNAFCLIGLIYISGHRKLLLYINQSVSVEKTISYVVFSI